MTSRHESLSERISRPVVEANVTNSSIHIWHPWLRRLRFSLRGLIVLVLVIGGGMGWMVHTARDARVQRATVAAIKQILNVQNTNVTHTGVQELQKVLP
jgi:spermidine synthase